MSKGITRIYLLFMLLSAASCSTSRHQQGFTYRPAQQGPGVSGSMTEETATAAPEKDNNTTVSILVEPAAPPAQAGLAEVVHPLPPATNSSQADLDLLTRLANGQAATATTTGPVDLADAVHILAHSYAAEKQVTLSEKQWKKLDRYAAKLQKKQQKADVDWGPNNNLEIFILAAAGVGLVVGLFSVGIGWLVFIVAALAYLYLKLLA